MIKGFAAFSDVMFGDPIGLGRTGLFGQCHGRWYLLNAQPSPIRRGFAVTPDQVSTEFSATIGRSECEEFASKLVKLARKSGGWSDFGIADLDAMGGITIWNHENAEFFVDMGWLVRGDEPGTYAYTEGFALLALSKLYKYTPPTAMVTA